MFYKRKKVVHLNFKNANAAKAANAADTANDTKEPIAEHILRLKFEKNMRKLFGVNKKI
jgi:hypothetical protein|uniref:Uncharacterized protein n=1 Tax=viral metagenome TaxID=1070528 RepID=A0A6C0CES2_9ZZZZ